MHMYCNYAKAHWTYADENPPVGLILCADKGQALARYAPVSYTHLTLPTILLV